MEKYIKNQVRLVEYGDYDNYAKLIPIKIVEQLNICGTYYPEYIVLFQYENTDKTIELVIKEKQIDFDSFAEYYVNDKLFLTYREAEIYCGENGLLCEENIFEVKE